MLKEGLIMNENEMQVLMANIMGGMHAFVCETCPSDELWFDWAENGIPDGCDEELLMDFATDKSIFKNVVEAFADYVKKI